MPRDSLIPMTRILFLLTLSGALFAQGPKTHLKVGDAAPDFTLPSTKGEKITLSSFKGKNTVVLAFFPAAFTGGCTKQCTSYAKAPQTLRDMNVAYFTASVDEPELNAKFAKSLNADYPILSDPSKEVARAYGVLMDDRGFARRVTFYIDKDGIIRAIDQQIRTEQAAEDTAAKLKELGLVEG